jgi:hypothetical protein
MSKWAAALTSAPKAAFPALILNTTAFTSNREIHWPLLNQPDRLEQEEFIERYRDKFEQAGVVEAERRSIPKLR